ncbi:MAG TPA: NAD-dependent epimerase/dehydratase family protein [Thermoanaerobaculia bacterium]|nr:NAD-dependent epimerase/dehydratase family protein [Thermoanaerobaculia bacterium]
MPTRRTFISGSIAAGTLLATGTLNAQTVTAEKAARPLRILILGGTGFTGPHQIRYAVARGHKVTMFNRGKTNPGLFPGVEHLRGDRNGELDALKNREWDAVIDVPATLPRWVRDTAQLLRDKAGQYVYISSLSAYRDNSKPGVDEDQPVAELKDPTVEQVTGETFGGLKALAEEEARKAFGSRATIIRPGLIVGPGDPTDRFTYWPVRIARGGDVLAPGDPLNPVQIIDARDLAEWIIRVVEQRAFGTYNAIGPAGTMTFSEMLGGIRGVVPGSVPVKLVWVPADFLEAQKVAPWSDMPVWIPAQGDYAGFGLRSNAKAIAAGLTFRPLADTARATLEFHESRPADRKGKLRAGVTAEREKEVLAAWKEAPSP